MAGNPEAVMAGAAELATVAEAFTSGAEGVRAAGNELAAGWSGAAAAAAGEMVTQIGTSSAVPGEIATAARPILETYAQALREAQEKFALGEQMAAQGAQTQLAEATQPAYRATDQATTQAAERMAQGEAMQAEAIAAEAQANDAAAGGIEALTAQVTSIVVPVPAAASGTSGPSVPPAGAQALVSGPGGGPLPGFGPVAAGAPPAPAEDDEGFSLSDIGHAVLDVGGLVPVLGEPLDLANAAWYGAEGDYVSAALSAGAAVPVAGWVFTGGKFVNKGVKLVDSAADARVWMKNRPPMVPGNAQRLPFTPNNAFPVGDKLRWPSTRNPGKTMEYWAHGPDPAVDVINNAGRGPIFRVSDGKEFLAGDGTWYRKNALNPNSPHYVPNAANDTHIPYPTDLPPPGAERFLAPNPISLADGVGGSGNER